MGQYTGPTGPLTLKAPTKPAAPAAAAGGYTFIDPSLAGQGAKLIPQGIANSGAHLYSPTIAATLAGTQYDQAITDAKQNLAMTQAGAAQALTNVQNWWNAIIGGQQRQAGADQALTTGVEHAEAGNNAGILASLGGAADPAASSVAVAGQNAQAILGGLGLNNEHYNNDMGTILRQGAAGAGQMQQNANQTNVAHAMQGVNDQVAAKGAAQAQDAYQIMKDNNQIRDDRATRGLQIREANNTTLDNRTTRLIDIVTHNNNTQQALDQMSETQKNDARNYALQLRQLGDAETTTKAGVIMSLGFDQKTGALTPEAQAAIQKLYPHIDPKALTGTSASIVASIKKANISANEQIIKASIASGEASSSLSGKNGFLTGKDGQPKLAKDGGVIPMGGWMRDPKSPTGVSQIPFGQPGSTLKAPPGGSSGATLDAKVSKITSSWIDGAKQSGTQITGYKMNKDGTGYELDGDGKKIPIYRNITTNGAGKLTWPQMLTKVASYSDPTMRQELLHSIQTQVHEGENGRPFTTPAIVTQAATQGAQAALQHHVPYAKAKQQLMASPMFPNKKLALAALDQVYRSQMEAGTHAGGGDNTGTTISPPPTGTAGSRGFTMSKSVGSGDNRPDTSGRMPLVHYNPA